MIAARAGPYVGRTLRDRCYSRTYEGMVDGESPYVGSFHNETFETEIFEVDGSMHYGPYGDDNAVLRDNSEDWGFEIVRVEQTPYNYPSTSLTVKVTDVAF